MSAAGTPARSSAATMDPAEVPTMTSAESGRQPVDLSSAASTPAWKAWPATPPAPSTRPTLPISRVPWDWPHGPDESTGCDVPLRRGRPEPDAHRERVGLRGTAATVRRPGADGRRQAAAGPALPPARALRADGARPA